jgi:hypothetical protein
LKEDVDQVATELNNGALSDLTLRDLVEREGSLNLSLAYREAAAESARFQDAGHEGAIESEQDILAALQDVKGERIRKITEDQRKLAQRAQNQQKREREMDRSVYATAYPVVGAEPQQVSTPLQKPRRWAKPLPVVGSTAPVQGEAYAKAFPKLGTQPPRASMPPTAVTRAATPPRAAAPRTWAKPAPMPNPPPAQQGEAYQMAFPALDATAPRVPSPRVAAASGFPAAAPRHGSTVDAASVARKQTASSKPSGRQKP